MIDFADEPLPNLSVKERSIRLKVGMQVEFERLLDRELDRLFAQSWMDRSCHRTLR